MFLMRKKTVKVRRDYITKLENRIAEENEQRVFYCELINKFREEVQAPYLKGQVDSKDIEAEVNSLSDEELLTRAAVHLKENFEGQRHKYFDTIQDDYFSVPNSIIDSICLLCFAFCSDALHNMPHHMLEKNNEGLRFDLLQYYQARYLVLQFIEKHLKEHMEGTPDYKIATHTLIENFRMSEFKI